MPELPEVETARRGIAPHVLGKPIVAVHVHNRQLRWPVPRDLAKHVAGQTIRAVRRRGKYLLLETAAGTLILHLGMSGRLRIVGCDLSVGKHDHLDIVFSDNSCLRLQDPRRFGSVHWTREAPLLHRLLRDLGPEPLDPGFDGSYLYESARGRKLAVKSLIMDSRVVVGVGNIYANEALFRAGIHPLRSAGRVSRERYERLADAIKTVLLAAIELGGTTLRDFLDSDGKPGYFRLALNVYDHAGAPCPVCARPIVRSRVGQRSTFYCTYCQR